MLNETNVQYGSLFRRRLDQQHDLLQRQGLRVHVRVDRHRPEDQS